FNALAAALLLASCQLGPFWDEYASKTATMKLLTYVPCYEQVTELPAHQRYYHLSYFSPPPDANSWAFVGYYNEAKQYVDGPVYLSFVVHLGLQHYTRIPTSGPPSFDRHPRCGVLLELPWSKQGNRPFSIPGQPETLRAITSSNARESLLHSALVCLLLALTYLLLLQPGCLRSERHHAPVALCCFIPIAIADIIVWCWAVGVPMQNIQAALVYYDFYDRLPEYLGSLLPLSWSEVTTLLKGPPYPPATGVGSLGSFLLALWCGFACWLLGCSRLVANSLFYWFGPDFVGDMVRQAAAEGRALTAEDIARMLTRASARLGGQDLERLKQEVQERIGHG